MIAFQTDLSEGIATITLTDSPTPGDLFRPRDIVKRALADGAQEVTLDLRGMEHIDSIAIGQLVACHSTALRHHASLRMVNISDTILKVLHTMKLDKVFNIITEN